LAGTIVGSTATLRKIGVFEPLGKWEICGLNPQPKLAVANCSQNVISLCHWVNTKPELGGLGTSIPPFAKLL